MEITLQSIAIGKPQTYGKDDNSFISSYKKDEYFQFIDVDELGIIGDTQTDKRYHGGVNKAIHFGSNVHFKNFKNLYNQDLDKLAIGCNIIVNGLDESNVNVGDIYLIGDVRVQVTQPRQPCWKIGALFGKDVSRYIIKNTACGWYVKVLQEGTLDLNDSIVLEKRESGFSIKDLSVYLHQLPDKDIIENILQIEPLATSYKKDLLDKIKP